MWRVDGGDSVAICGNFRSFDPVPVPEWPEIFFFNDDDQRRPLLDTSHRASKMFALAGYLRTLSFSQYARSWALNRSSSFLL